MRRRHLIGLAALAALLIVGAFAGAQAGGEPTVETRTFTNVVTYTVPTVTETVTVTTETEPPPPPPSGETVILVDDPFVCNAALSGRTYALVKVTMGHGEGDAIRLAGCDNVTIHRLECDTFSEDCLKVTNALPVSDNVTVNGGYLECHELDAGAHQDGIQAMGGSNLLFRGLRIDCEIAGAGHYFVNRAGAGATTPTDVVCDGCYLGPNPASSSAIIGNSLRSGLRNSTLCPDRTPSGGPLTIQPSAVQPVNENNTFLGSC
jgi:hypothetical protein